MITIGLTGGIGCGKSYVSRIMATRGIPVYDSDSHARTLTSTDSWIREQLIHLVGGRLYEGGQFHKEILAEFIFGNPSNLTAVNSIIHPRVKADFTAWKESRACNEFLAFESAILFESGMDDCVDYVVAVHAPLELRIERCLMRASSSRESILKRMESQMPQEEKCNRADYVLINDNVIPLEPQIDEILTNCKTNILL